MTLARIFGFYLLSLGWSLPLVGGFVAQADFHPDQSSPRSDSQTPPQSQGDASTTQTQNPQSTQPASSSSSPTAATSQTAPKRRRVRKKTIYPNCPDSPPSTNPVAGNTTKKTANGSNSASSTNPCPPPKKVVRNGGSKEPTIQLTGGTASEQASDQHSTEQLTASTRENLKKIEGRELNPNQREMVNQIKQFMEQSKEAVASGDAERGRNLAMKASLLSEELAKP